MNITKPALYYYVKNKEDILLQCTEISLDFVRAALLAANEGGGTGVERLRTFFRKYSQHVTGDYGYSLIREGEKHLNGKRKSELFSHLRAGQEVLMEIIALGIADGTIAPCRAKHVAYILFSTFNQMPVWYDPFGPLSISELTDQLLDLVMRGLEPR
jgi:AcrR family transcriptional regulator